MAVDTPTTIDVQAGWEVVVDLPDTGLHGLTLTHDGIGSVTLDSDGAATVELDGTSAVGITMDEE